VKKYGPLYAKGTIPAKSYPGQDKPASTVDVWNLLIVNEKMNEKLAHDLVKATFENKAELQAVHSEAANLDLSKQYEIGAPIPWHPGAQRYFAEKGLKPR
jgi:uncharacterized protein